MTPDEAISAAFRAASHEMARGMTDQKANAYEGFLIQTSGALDNAAQAFASVARLRPEETADQIAALERYAYYLILQATIGCLMSLGHFPYLPNVDGDRIEEKLC